MYKYIMKANSKLIDLVGLRANMLNFNIYCVISSLIIGSRALDLPSYFPKCCLNDPKLNECLFNASNTLKPYLLNGVKEIKLPSLNPYVIPLIKATQKLTFANYSVIVKNFTFQGLENYKVVSLRYDPLLLKLSGDIEFAQIKINAFYNVNSMVIIPVSGKGYFSGVLEFNAPFEISGKMVTRDNEKYFNPVSVNIPLIMNSVGGHLSGLANKEFANYTNQLLNAKSKPVEMAITLLFQEFFERLVSGYVKWIASEVPYKRIFPC